MKRIGVLLLAVLLVTFSLGCGGVEDTPTEAEATKSIDLSGNWNGVANLETSDLGPDVSADSTFEIQLSINNGAGTAIVEDFSAPVSISEDSRNLSFTLEDTEWGITARSVFKGSVVVQEGDNLSIEGEAITDFPDFPEAGTATYSWVLHR